MNPDVLLSMATTAERGLDCYGYAPRARTIWLLNNEVFALDALGRLAEAEPLVNLFFERFFDTANDEYKARFYAWGFHFKTKRGRYVSAVSDYNEAEKYITALPTDRQAQLLTDGAQAYLVLGDFQAASRIATKAVDRARADSTADMKLAYARALQMRGEIGLALFRETRRTGHLDEVSSDLRQAIRLREGIGSNERLSTVSTLLGEAFIARGDSTSGQRYLGQGLEVARNESDVRSRIFALWRQGALALADGALESAGELLSESLDLSRSSGILEFELFIMLELGRVSEELEQWGDARTAFQFVIDNTSEESESYEEVKARKEAQEKLIRLLLQPQYHRWSDPVFWAAIVALLIAIAVLLYTNQHLRLHIRDLQHQLSQASNETPTQAEQGSPLHPQPPTNPPTIPSAEHFDLIAHTLNIPAPSDTHDRVWLIYRVLSDSRTFRREINHPVARDRLDRIERKMGKPQDLFACVEAWEEERGTVFKSGKPGNAVGSQLRTKFGRLGISWPRSIQEWGRLLGLVEDA